MTKQIPTCKSLAEEETRQNFDEILEQVYRQNKAYQITRNNKAMGWLVGDAFMERMGNIINYIIEYEPTLADTLVVMLDDNIRSVIDEGRKEWARGERIPLEKALI